MPALKNHRQERFCQLIKQGIPPFRAYPMAGYKAHPGEPYRLRDNPRVKQRLKEITRSLAMKTRVTVESVTADLDRIAAGAEAAQQYGAAKGAVETKAKLHGLLIDRKETGDPGAFAGLQDEAAVMAMVRAELGEAAAQQLKQALRAVDEEQETSSAAEEVDLIPLKPVLSPPAPRVDEVSAALTMLRPGKRPVRR